MNERVIGVTLALNKSLKDKGVKNEIVYVGFMPTLSINGRQFGVAEKRHIKTLSLFEINPAKELLSDTDSVQEIEDYITSLD